MCIASNHVHGVPGSCCCMCKTAWWGSPLCDQLTPPCLHNKWSTAVPTWSALSCLNTMCVMCPWIAVQHAHQDYARHAKHCIQQVTGRETAMTPMFCICHEQQWRVNASCQQYQSLQPPGSAAVSLASSRSVGPFTSLSLRPSRGLGPSWSSQHSWAKGAPLPPTPPNISKPESTATMTGPARVPGALPLLFCKQNSDRTRVLNGAGEANKECETPDDLTACDAMAVYESSRVTVGHCTMLLVAAGSWCMANLMYDMHGSKVTSALHCAAPLGPAQDAAHHCGILQYHMLNAAQPSTGQMPAAA